MTAILGELTALCPSRVSAHADVRRQHANTLTSIATELPDAVVWPVSTAEVQHIVRLAARYRVPIIPFGAGTSLEGHVNAPRGGVAIAFEKMNNILEVRPDDLDCTVEAGVTLQRLASELRATGLFFPVDPGADNATLGGMAATRASGTTTVRYGSMRDNVVSLTAVMATGEIVRTARRARKSASGYDLTRLLVGSEGTLGIITELTLKLYGVPERIVAAVAAFATVASACKSATEAIQAGLGLARCELLDATQIRCVNAQSKLSLAECPTLFVEFHGSAASMASDLAAFASIAYDEGASAVETASSDVDRRRLWTARHDAFWAVKSAWPGKQVLVTDVAVPLSKLAEAVTETEKDILSHNLIAPLVGHVGDGNFHAIVVFDADDTEAHQTIDGFLARLVKRAVALDGTATGEHGIGQGKMRFLEAEHGAGVGVMRAIKKALDPLEILNPGKIF